MPIVIDPPEAPPLPPPADDGSNLWELPYESLGFHRDDDEANDFALRKWCEAECAPLQAVYDLVREREGQAGWAVLYDADECPVESLPYLAQISGVVITPEMTEEQIRGEIKEPTGWKRGQPEAIRIALRRTLTGEEPLVIIRPRTPEVGHHYIRTLKSQTPEPERTERVLREKIPAWEKLDFAAIDGVSLADLEAGWELLEDLEAAFTTLGEIEDLLPTELPE